MTPPAAPSRPALATPARLQPAAQASPPPHTQASPPPEGPGPGPLGARLLAAGVPLAHLLDNVRPGWTGVPTAADRPAWEAIAARDPVTAADVVSRAQRALGQPWPHPRLTDYVRYFRDGNRTVYEGQIAALRARLGYAALAGALTGDDAWVDEAADGVAALCEQLTWCWAAHERFVAGAGAVVPDPTHPYLDLGAAEAVSVLAWTDHLLGWAFDARVPGLRGLIRGEADRRVFSPYVSTEPWWWIADPTTVINWSPWITSQVLASGLLLLDDPGRRAEVVATALARLDIYLQSLPDDGGIDEGFAYWWQGVGRLLEALWWLDRATGDALRLTDFPPLAEAVRFPARMRWSGTVGTVPLVPSPARTQRSRDWYVNAADGSARAEGGLPWWLVHRWARVTGDEALASVAATYRDRTQPAVVLSDALGLGRALAGLTDPEWLGLRPRDVGGRGPTTPSLRQTMPDVWLPTTGVAICHGAGGLSFALKGGHNDESHNHCDVGQVTIALDGVPYVIDAGATTYTAKTFSPRRYELWPMRSGWHNVPAPWGAEQPPGRQYAARNMSLTTHDGRRIASVEVAGAYDLPGLYSWRRTVTLDRDGTRVTVTDVARGTTGESALPSRGEPLLTVNYLLAGLVARGDDFLECRGPEAWDVPTPEGPWLPAPHRAADAPPPRVLRLTWDTTTSVTLETRVLDDARLARVWGTSLTRLTLRAPATARALAVTMTALPPRYGRSL